MLTPYSPNRTLGNRRAEACTCGLKYTELVRPARKYTCSVYGADALCQKIHSFRLRSENTLVQTPKLVRRALKNMCQHQWQPANGTKSKSNHQFRAEISDVPFKADNSQQENTNQMTRFELKFQLFLSKLTTQSRKILGHIRSHTKDRRREGLDESPERPWQDFGRK